MKTHTTVDADWLSSFVVKDGVLLGGLSEPQRRAAMALAWVGLPAAEGFTEPQINDALKQQLAGALSCLGIDHVELRRWLVDCAFLTRDGFGRRYAPARLAALPELSLRGAEQVLAALADQPVAAWVETHRQAHRSERAARRERHLARHAA